MKPAGSAGSGPWKTKVAARWWLQPLPPHCQLLGMMYPRMHWKEAFFLLTTTSWHGAQNPEPPVALLTPCLLGDTPQKSPPVHDPPGVGCLLPAAVQGLSVRGWRQGQVNPFRMLRAGRWQGSGEPYQHSPAICLLKPP